MTMNWAGTYTQYPKVVSNMEVQWIAGRGAAKKSIMMPVVKHREENVATAIDQK
jgi:hypothetical protein